MPTASRPALRWTFIVIAVLVIAAGVFWAAHRITHRTGSRLVPMPPAHPTLFEEATAARKAIRAGNFAKAERLIAADFRNSRIGRWHFRPYAGFIEYVAAPSDATFRKRLDAWVAGNPKSATAYLIRADYEHNLAWWIRGHGFAGDVQPDKLAAFDAQNAAAARDIQAALTLDQKNPYAWFLDVLIQRDAGGNAAQASAFQDAIGHYPNYYALYSVRLGALQPKWYGSVIDMYAFVNRYAGATPATSPLRVLYLELYSHLLDAASIHCHQQASSNRSQCLEAAMAQITTPAITRSAEAAVTQLLRGGQVDALDEIGEQIKRMLWVGGGGRYALPFLEGAASALHSDTQLSATDAAHNNYMIDQATAVFWEAQDVDASAEALDRRALEDLRNTHFASVNAEDAARAGIYNDLVGIYNDRSDYPHLLAYGNAVAELLGGDGATPDYDRLSCEALFRLKRYQEGLRTCTAIVEASDDLQAEFFRARIYEALGRAADAIEGYATVADSSADRDFRTYAAIELSIIHDNRHAYAKALATLDHYAYLFPADSSDTYGEASYFNDRCYDEMHLGKLNDALHDCNLSIGFQPLPDALKKRAEITRQLTAHSGPRPSA